MRVTVIEANMTGLQHSVINRQILNMLLMNKTLKWLSLYCSKEHYSALNIENERLSFLPLKVLKPGKYRIIKFFLEFVQTINVILTSEADILILLSSFPNVQFFLILFSFIYKKKKLIIITHGEAEGLVMKGKWKIWSYPFWITLAFNLSVKENIFRIVLGKSIYENLKKLNKEKHCFYIDHPYEDFQDENHTIPMRHSNIFAYIGNCLEKKGGNIFVDVAQKCSDAKFWIIGAYDLPDRVSLSNLSILSETGMLSFEDFNNSIQKITYACYPYPSNSYRFTASGAIFDAIKYLKPVIYIKNDYFDNIFNDAGDIGYRCENEEEFLEIILKTNKESDFNRYQTQIRNLKNIRNKFSIDKIEKDLNTILQNVLSESKHN